MNVVVISNRHELIRIFARINAIPKEELRPVVHGRDIAGLDFTDDQVVWVVGTPNGDVVGEVRRRAEAKGARLSYAEPYDLIESLTGVDTSQERVTAEYVPPTAGTRWPPEEA